MRCIVKDCKNHEHEGQFIGNLCFPCHTYISKGQGEYSQAFRNAQRTWVKLTDDEIDTLWAATPDHPDGHEFVWFARAADAKLQEKNT